MAIADTLTEVGQAGSITTLSAPGKAVGTFNINVGSTANWPSNGKTVYFGMRTVNPSAVTTANPSGLVAGTYSEWKGIVGTNAITSMVLQTGSTDQTYTAGSNTQVFISVNAPRENALVQWGQVHADNQGNLLGPAVLTALGQTAQTGAGWQTLGTTITANTYNGNRSYTATTSSDQTGVLSPGMRLLTTRTVPGPTQCTNLNGTSQYFGKTSPAGMTATDDIAAGGWFKIPAYPASYGALQSTYNGTNGWTLAINSDGTIEFVGFNGGGANNSKVKSYQSVPINKWFHIVPQLDMSSFTTTPTTSYIMLDGQDIPVVVSRTGTNPTAFVATNQYQIGAQNGASFHNGKAKEVFVTSAKLTQTQAKAIYSQGITTADTATYSMVSAYSFNNSINDLNTTNANNLTANGSAVATNADSFCGNNGVSSSLDYGIVTAVTSTTITFQVPEGSTVPTSGGVSTVSYSTQATPFGFPGLSRFALSAYDSTGTPTLTLAAAIAQFIMPNPIDGIQVSNPGTGAGTMYLYMKGSEKKIVGLSASQNATTPGLLSYTITLPIFFTTIQNYQVASINQATRGEVFANGYTTNVTTIGFGLLCTTGGAASQASYTVTGF